MNWGLKIVLGLGAFIIFIVSAGIYMVTKNTDTLEDEDYYEKSLSYDEVYQRKQNLLDDHARPTVNVRNDTLYITFSKPHNRGDLIFKRPSDSMLDITLPFVTEGQDYRLPVSSFTKGSWRLEISWEQGETLYTSDHNLYL
ncbi:FixH family protein [Sphingobacterium chuzhouense]|uniref:FixH family protein n=1 Tax=Sphingobacterium chuzhouense TaxID=1742264 RepID=A0ABR7XVM3_9SPHI|nr:FixH family protein [Sphingobacterium chuzhouense]MBD1423105.1 FixH family protein [Sphingobacterium chuzhouense]